MVSGLHRELGDSVRALDDETGVVGARRGQPHQLRARQREDLALAARRPVVHTPWRVLGAAAERRGARANTPARGSRRSPG